MMTGRYSADLWVPDASSLSKGEVCRGGIFRQESVVVAPRQKLLVIGTFGAFGSRAAADVMGRRGFLALLAAFPLLLARGSAGSKAVPGLSGKRAMFVTRITGS